MSATDPGATEAGGRAAKRGELIAAGLLSAALVLPFLDKGVHQDDWAYLRVAQLLTEHGAEVFGQTTHYQGEIVEAGNGVLHGPVWLLCMAFAQLFGEHFLLVGHLIGTLLMGLLGASCASLAARLGARPVLTALTFCAAPAPLVLAPGLMTDMPMLALFSMGLALAVEGHCRGRSSLLLIGGVCGALAALTRYHGLAAVPLLAVLPLLWPPWRWRGLIPAATALAVFLGTMLGALAITGQWDVLRATDGMMGIKINHTACLMSAVCALGGVGVGWVFGLLAAPISAARALVRDRASLVLAMGGAALGVWFGLKAPTIVPAPVAGANVAVFWGAFVFGGAVLGLLLRPWTGLVPAILGGRLGEWRTVWGPRALIALWSLGFVFAAWWTVPFGSTRYALPALPGMFLLAGLASKRLLPTRSAWVALVASGLFGVGAAQADRAAANVYPELAADVALRVAPDGDWSTGKTWIWGELGFRWYLEEVAGLEILPSRSNAPASGDRILKSRILCTAANDDGSGGRYRLHEGVRRRMRPGPITVYADPWPIRIHNSHAGAGFYGHEAGFLPWSFSTHQHDELQVWTIEDTNPFLERLGEAQIEVSEYPPAQAGGRTMRGSIGVERFMVDVDQPSKLAVQILFPGRVTWHGVPIPPGSVFTVDVGEHHRLTYEGIEGPGCILRVRIDGKVVAEKSIDTRRGDPKLWQSLWVDLAPWAGSEVDLSFELAPMALPEGSTPGQPVVILGGFAEPRIVSR
ncbi:hypothetical protein [Engelhardtia mirabilis]|uniref:Glycosyltransferase RgtA/B/C/D-like domain-containing protein n=1 Tax=Engelhardtia mirabilis TaxID=2528011 RepID=A0A518BL84_9BACT|nr:hypothetical protein Pla133_28290 [Planctomycetes bacterium Pla133]QDV02066.1 hypothetical protein Pla86_28280 [Planctomycetes bacterium Pla86]